jgi:hypothetical protein
VAGEQLDACGIAQRVDVETELGGDVVVEHHAINGEVRQDGNTSDLIFDVPMLVSFLSSITTLVTGDLIFTGTPEGVGAAQGKYLADGDVITTTIDGIGTMSNRVKRISDALPIGG